MLPYHATEEIVIHGWCACTLGWRMAALEARAPQPKVKTLCAQEQYDFSQINTLPVPPNPINSNPLTTTT